jgi:hypothetical protein
VLVFDIVAGVASIVGLCFSILAFVEAWSASRAARQARDAILSRTVAEEVELACVKGDQLLDLLEHDRFLEASLRARDLTSALSEIPHRRSLSSLMTLRGILGKIKHKLDVGGRQ